MKLFEKILKKRNEPAAVEDLTVEIETAKDLTNEQKEIIKRIVKRGILTKSSLSDIGIAVIMEAGVFDPVIITKEQNHIKIRI